MATFMTTFGGTLTDDPLVPRVTLVKVVHVTELRLATDRERSRRSLAAFAWTDPILALGSALRAVHVSEMHGAGSGLPGGGRAGAVAGRAPRRRAPGPYRAK
jgi:hypothetical protein